MRNIRHMGKFTSWFGGHPDQTVGLNTPGAPAASPAGPPALPV